MYNLQAYLSIYVYSERSGKIMRWQNSKKIKKALKIPSPNPHNL
jgi:hypothetical protein